MFLFRKKNENNDVKPAKATKAELLRPDKSKTKTPEKAKGKTVEAESVLETLEIPKAEAKDFPVKIVVPASALKEEEAKDSAPAAIFAPPEVALPDEVVDSLLKPGHQRSAKPDEVKPAPVSAEAKKLNPTPVSLKTDSGKAVKEGEGKENIFSSLFGNEIEEEENSLTRLIKNLPELSIEEVLGEAEEVKNLIMKYSSR